MQRLGAKALLTNEELPLKRIMVALFVLGALAFTAAPASAGVTRNVIWRCTIADGSTVDFVTAPDHAYHGLSTANVAASHAATVLGETCVVDRD